MQIVLLPSTCESNHEGGDGSAELGGEAGGEEGDEDDEGLPGDLYPTAVHLLHLVRLHLLCDHLLSKAENVCMKPDCGTVVVLGALAIGRAALKKKFLKEQ